MVVVDCRVQLHALAADVHRAGAYGEIEIWIWRVGGSRDAIAVIRRATGADKIERIFPHLFAADVLRFVPISLKRNATLLHYHRAVLLLLVVSDSRFVAGHVRSFLFKSPGAGRTVGESPR